MTTRARWAVVAGGGTAGHVLPALALGAELVARGVDKCHILFVGSSRGLEARLVPEAGFPALLLGGRGIERKLSVQNVRSLIGLVGAAAATFTEFVRRRPAIVASVGGYASSPAVVAAVLLRVPLVVIEQNARAGIANRIASRFATTCAVAFDGTGLPRAILTGNPVRSKLLETAKLDLDERRQNAKRELGIDHDCAVVTVFGGSLGARRINDAVIELVRLWSSRSDLFVYHISGDRDHDQVRRRIDELQQELGNGFTLKYRLVPYEDRMDTVYSATDVCVCRAGATSIADLAIMGIPAVLIPLPSAAEDHQTINAQGVVSSGGAILIADSALTGEVLKQTLVSILDDETVQRSMKAGQLKRARPLAAAAIVDILVAEASRPAPAHTLSDGSPNEHSA